MSSYSCIIVEDEPLAVEILTDYINQVPFLELKYVCQDAIYAIEILQQNKVDLIFLDIHLPKIKGLDFLELLKDPPHVIITSAYQDYALQAFTADVLDYLLKPIRFSRFLKAVNKLNDRRVHSMQIPGPTAAAPGAYYFFNVGKKKVKIYLDEILYIEAIREYVRIYTKEKNILTKFLLHELEEVLSPENFIRVHRSFIVAKDKVSAFTATDVEINNKQIPIGRSYKESVIAVLETR
jgi:DNA-binding LytR/AlgR family response regulator